MLNIVVIGQQYTWLLLSIEFNNRTEGRYPLRSDDEESSLQ